MPKKKEETKAVVVTPVTPEVDFVALTQDLIKEMETFIKDSAAAITHDRGTRRVRKELRALTVGMNKKLRDYRKASTVFDKQ